MKPNDFLDFVNKIFNGFEGKVLKEDKRISIVSSNAIGVDKKKVECKCIVGFLESEEFPYYVDGEEKTYCILGGCGYPCVNEDEVEKDILEVMKRYNFTRRNQLSIFDFI